MLPQTTPLSDQGDSSAEPTTARPSLIDTLLSNFLSSNSQQTASLPAHDDESRFFLVEHGRRNRALAETYIAKRCAKVSNTRVIAFTPRLFTLRQSGGSVCGSFGLRSAQGRLLVEQFLERPIEHYIGACSASKVERQGIVEADHLWTSAPASTNALLTTLIERVRRESIRWLVLSGTTPLLTEFLRIGLSVFTIDIAESEHCRSAERTSIEYTGVRHFIVLVNVDEGFEAHGLIPRSGSPP